MYIQGLLSKTLEILSCFFLFFKKIIFGKKGENSYISVSVKLWRIIDNESAHDFLSLEQKRL